jgi:hypothetical protein
VPTHNIPQPLHLPGILVHVSRYEALLFKVLVETLADFELTSESIDVFFPKSFESEEFIDLSREYCGCEVSPDNSART